VRTANNTKTTFAAARSDSWQLDVQVSIQFSFGLLSLLWAIVKTTVLLLYLIVLATVKVLTLMLWKPWLFGYIVFCSYSSLVWLQDAEFENKIAET
jgi:hypothetical protein